MRFIASCARCTPGNDHDESLACAYRIAWSLNPHTVIGSSDPERAQAQHARLLRTVRDAGATVTEVPFVHGAYDSVFAKDNAVYVDHEGTLRATMAGPHHRERQAEQHARATQLAKLGVHVSTRTAPFEGGDVLVRGDRCFFGYGFRSSLDAVPYLQWQLGMTILPLELVDPLLYHLDTALAVLHDGTAVVCEAGFTPAALVALRAVATRWIAVPREDAIMLALNFVEIGDTIVTGTDSALVRGHLERLGKRVIVTPLDEFQRAGGSAACLLAPIATA
jgi:N-dimethylarginine dimethylaminohydrolase